MIGIIVLIALILGIIIGMLAEILIQKRIKRDSKGRVIKVNN